MRELLDHPLELFFAGLALFLLAAWAGAWIQRRSDEPTSEAFELVQGATLTLLGLLLGFTFAMAVSRFDLRMELAVDEANAIETAWLRAGLLPDQMNTQSRALLLTYANARLELRKAGPDEGFRAAAEQHAQQTQMKIWTLGEQAAAERRDSISALYLTSLNQAFDLRTKRAEAYDNRIPAAAWTLLLFIGVASNLLVGFSIGRRWWLLWVLPLVVAGTLMLVGDLDSPVSGSIRVDPQAMERLPAEMQQ